MAKSTLTILVTSPERVVFDGRGESVIVPGEQGTFEVLPLHRALISRLAAGRMTIDRRSFEIRRGVLRIADDVVTAVVELP